MADRYFNEWAEDEWIEHEICRTVTEIKLLRPSHCR